MDMCCRLPSTAVCSSLLQGVPIAWCACMRVDFGEQDAFSLDNIAYAEHHRWSNYQRGVAVVLQERGFDLPGVDVAIQSDVPAGAGLSSSAALEVSMAVVWQTLVGFDLSRPDLALLCQRRRKHLCRRELWHHGPIHICAREKGAALLIDCRSLDYRAVALPRVDG